MPDAVCAKIAIQHCEYFRARYRQVLGSKKFSPNKIHVADSLCVGELVDVVDRVLPHGIFDTSEDTGISPISRNWCVLELFLYLPRSVMGAWRARFLREPTSLTLLKCKYKGNYFLTVCLKS